MVVIWNILQMSVHGRLDPQLEDLLGEDRNFRTLMEEDYGDQAFEGYTFARPTFPPLAANILPVWCNVGGFNFPCCTLPY